MSLTQAFNWAVAKCNSENVGYSQAYRRGQVVNGIEYYDCSSFIAAALTAGGYFQTNPWFATSSEISYLKQINFSQLSTTVPWQAGDILWRQGHTEMVYEPAPGGGGRTMGAHTDEVPLADQVSINNYVTSPGTYTYLFRAPDIVITLEWIKGNRYLSRSEMDNNAQIIASYLTNKGWTKVAISGMLGNMQAESTINPGIWQSLSPNPSLGYGLVQWTPSTKWSEWAAQNGYAMDDGNGQIERILYEVANNLQWQKVTTDMTFQEFTQFSGSVSEATILFELNYEQHAGDVQPERQQYAQHYFDTLDFTGGIVPVPPLKKRKYMKIWMYPALRRDR